MSANSILARKESGSQKITANLTIDNLGVKSPKAKSLVTFLFASGQANDPVLVDLKPLNNLLAENWLTDRPVIKKISNRLRIATTDGFSVLIATTKFTSDMENTAYHLYTEIFLQ